MSERSVFVDIDMHGKALPVGRLWSRSTRGKDSASFEYAPDWLLHSDRFALEPALVLGVGPQHTPQGKALFGAFGDSAPDRWGRMLIRRDHLRRARQDGVVPRSLGELDFLLGVSDLTRQGALRFRLEADGSYLAEEDANKIPPLIQLGELMGAAMRLSADDDTPSDDDLRLVLRPGSSLGGARAKASVRDRNGGLLIAKFSQPDDPHPVIRWEAVAMELAASAGVQTPPNRMVEIAGEAVLLLERFDRDGERRIPYLSAMSMLGAQDNEERSYLEVFDAIRQFGCLPEADSTELWRRIVFNILISNTDDHLRNHGFLFDVARGAWRLSPAFDLNPTPSDLRPAVLTLSINEVDNTADLNVALGIAARCGLSQARAKSIIAEVAAAVSQWRVVASRMGLSASQVDRMASAFRVPLGQ